MRSSIIILAAVALSIPIALVTFAVVPFALAYGATVDLFDREKSELRRENARLTARVNELCEALAERACPAPGREAVVDRRERLFGKWSER